MSSTAPDPTGLLAEAQRRATRLRESGELPTDIDERLSDDYGRTLRRQIDRSPADLSADIAAILESADPASDQWFPKLVRRIGNRLLPGRRRGMMQLRQNLAAGLTSFTVESERIARLADDAVATSDALAARVTELERQLTRQRRNGI